VLESLGAAMPGIGFLIGGVIATVGSPRLAFAVAGAGVMAIVAVSALLLGRNWSTEQGMERSKGVDAAGEIMVELIPTEAIPSLDRRS